MNEEKKGARKSNSSERKFSEEFLGVKNSFVYIHYVCVCACELAKEYLFILLSN
jgi:hypothetical protein